MFDATSPEGAAARADIGTYREMLAQANARMNLVGATTLDAFELRHARDSAQLYDLAPDAATWADLGTGAGLPGVILAILLKGRPGAKVHLVESIAKKCRFLETVVAALDLPAQVHNARAENLKLDVDIVTARACAPLVRLLDYAEPCFARGAMGLFLKGRTAEAEIDEARGVWSFQAETLPSITDPEGRIIRITELKRARRR